MTEETGAAAPTDEQAAVSAPAESEQATQTPEQPAQDAAAENAETEKEGTQDNDVAEERQKQSRNERYKRKISAQAGLIDRVATENAALKAEIEAIKKAQKAEPAPNPADFEQGEFDPRYIAKLASIEAKKELRAELEERSTRDKQDHESKQYAERKRQIDAYASEAAALIPDFQSTVEEFSAEIGGVLPEHIQAALGATGKASAYIVYQMAKDPDLADKILNASPLEAALAIGELKAKTSLPNPKTKTSAPPPLKTPSGAAAKPVDLTALAKSDDMSAFIAMRREQSKARA
jgi:hypothetical protein